ncbi:MAG: outer membrane beta-barrel protein [Bacteroidales bacterium]
MKKTLLLVAAGLMLITTTHAQKAEIGAFYGISFNSKIRTYYGDYKVDNKANYGGQLSIALSSETFVELMYNRTDTRIQYFSRGGASDPLDISIEYFHIGGLQQVDIGSDKIAPFGVFTLGPTRFNLKDPVDFDDDGTPESYGDAWAFSIALAGGAKIFLAERIGIRLQARLGMPMLFNGLYIGVGGGGASGGASFHVPLVQFDLTAGIFLRL